MYGSPFIDINMMSVDGINKMRRYKDMKTKKKVGRRILCFVLVVVLMLSSEGMLPQISGSGFEKVQAQAATVRLNRTSCVLDIGKTMYLKMLGTKSKPKWYTSNKNVVAVSSIGLVAAKKTGSAVITAKIGKKSYKCRVRVSSMERFCNAVGRPFDGKSYYYGQCNSSGKGLYRYDIATGKKKKLTGLFPLSTVDVSGDYVYFDAWSSDSKYRNIYRVSKNGGTPHRLAKGLEPVVLGKHIYYVTYQDNNVYMRTSLYRMDLNGNNKRSIYKKSDNSYFSCKGVYNGKYVLEVVRYSSNNERTRRYYAIDSYRNLNWVYISSYYMHGNWSFYNSSDYGDIYDFEASDNTSGYVYEISGRKLIRRSGSSRKVLRTFSSDITDVVDYGSYLKVITRGVYDREPTYNLYFISASGKTVRKILTNEMYID